MGDRRNYVMTMEVAMAREMAYRNKLESLGTTSSGNGNGKDPLHFQVSTLASSQGLTTASGSASSSFDLRTSSPGFIPNKRPWIPGSVQLARPPPSQHSHSTLNSLWSPIISADTVPVPKPSSSSRPINFADQKRKAPVHWDKPPVQIGTFFCLLCQIDCTTSYNLMMHYQGQRHRAKLGQPTAKKVPSVSPLKIAKERIYCKFCGIWCKDEFTFRVHLQCKNHNHLLHEFEKKMKKPM